MTRLARYGISNENFMPISKTRFKVLRTYNRFPDGKFGNFVLHIWDSMHANPKFPKPPISMDDLKSKIDNFQAWFAEAIHRDTRVIAQKNSVRAAITKDIDLLGTYVDVEAGQDEDAFASSGFDKVPSEYAGPKPLAELNPGIASIEQGLSKQLKISIVSLGREARSYQLRGGENGTAPESWPIITVTSVKSPTVFDELKPGVVYAFQVRAHTRLGYTDWSGFTTRMCI